MVSSAYAARPDRPSLDRARHPPRARGVPARLRRLSPVPGVPLERPARALAADGEGRRTRTLCRGVRPALHAQRPADERRPGPRAVARGVARQRPAVLAVAAVACGARRPRPGSCLSLRRPKATVFRPPDDTCDVGRLGIAQRLLLRARSERLGSSGPGAPAPDEEGLSAWTLGSCLLLGSKQQPCGSGPAASRSAWARCSVRSTAPRPAGLFVPFSACATAVLDRPCGRGDLNEGKKREGPDAPPAPGPVRARGGRTLAAGVVVRRRCRRGEGR